MILSYLLLDFKSMLFTFPTRKSKNFFILYPKWFNYTVCNSWLLINKFIFPEAYLSLNLPFGGSSWIFFPPDQYTFGIQSCAWISYISIHRIHPNMKFLMVTLWFLIEVLSSYTCFMPRNVCSLWRFKKYPITLIGFIPRMGYFILQKGSTAFNTGAFFAGYDWKPHRKDYSWSSRMVSLILWKL